MGNVEDFRKAVLTYNNKQWSFRGLKDYFEDNEEESEVFFEKILPKIVALSLSTQTSVTRAIPLLKCGRSAKVTFSQRQVATLLANAFLCTFPR